MKETFLKSPLPQKNVYENDEVAMLLSKTGSELVKLTRINYMEKKLGAEKKVARNVFSLAVYRRAGTMAYKQQTFFHSKSKR